MDHDEIPPDQHELLEAFDKVVEQFEHPEPPTGSPPRSSPTGTRPWIVLLLLLSSGMLGYVWLGRPTWLYPPDPAVFESPSQREATLRFGIYLQRERVKAFRREHGRLPSDLAETDAVEEGVSYQPTGDSTFVITGTDDSLTLTLASDASAEEFLRPAGIMVPDSGQ